MYIYIYIYIYIYLPYLNTYQHTSISINLLKCPNFVFVLNIFLKFRFCCVCQLTVWCFSINIFLVIGRNTEAMCCTVMSTKGINRFCKFCYDVGFQGRYI